MAAQLTKPLIVPEFTNGFIKLYTPDSVTGAPKENPNFTVNVQAVLDSLFPGQGRTAKPNCCRLNGADLFVALSSQNSQCVVKLPCYLANPAAATAQAFVFTLDGNDYVGLAFDAAGNLYVAEANFLDNMIVRYSGADPLYLPAPAARAGDNYVAAGATRTTIGNAGMTSYFGDLAFDAKGNLWVADYKNHRVVAFDQAGLGGTNTYHVLANPPGPLAVANTDPGLTSSANYLFAEPEGLDFDGSGNLWVANNNDGGAGGVINTLTSLVMLDASLQEKVLATANGGIVSGDVIMPNTNCFIYNAPNNADGTRPQFGGLQIDTAAGRLYVNEEIGGNGRAYDLASIAATPADPSASLLTITTTNPGNGGLALIMLGSQRNGLNHVGMELGDFDRETGPVRDTNYPTYTDKLLDWYQTKNVKSVRLTFTWEAVQLALEGPVPATATGVGYKNYWDDLTSVLTRLLARDISVILCPWQYNSASNDTDVVYDGAKFTSAQFADFWGKFAAAINGVTGADQLWGSISLTNRMSRAGTETSAPAWRIGLPVLRPPLMRFGPPARRTPFSFRGWTIQPLAPSPPTAVRQSG